MASDDGVDPNYDPNDPRYLDEATRQALVRGMDPTDVAQDPGGQGFLFPWSAGALGLSYSNPNDYGYGNFTPGAQQAITGYQQRGDTMLGNAAPRIARTDMDFSGQGPTGGQFGNPAYVNQMVTRGQQQQFADQLRSDMAGNAPSLAQLQLRQGADMALQNQAAMAASGGPTNYAFAQRNAAQQGAQTMQNLSAQQGMLRAQEYAQARGELGSALNQQRVQDLQATGMSYQNAIAQAQMEAQRNQQQAAMQYQQNALNQAGMLGFYQMGQNVANSDLQSRMHYMDLMASKRAQDLGQANNAVQSQQYQQQLTRQDIGTGLQVAGAVMGGI